MNMLTHQGPINQALTGRKGLTVPYSGNPDTGLTVEWKPGRLALVTPQHITDIFNAMKRFNPLLDATAPGDSSSLLRLSKWLTSQKSDSSALPDGHDVAASLLAVFGAEGLVPMDGIDNPRPGEFIDIPTGDALLALKGRKCIYEERSQYAHVTIVDIAVDEEFTSLHLLVDTLDGFTWKGPSSFVFGGIEWQLSCGYASLPYVSGYLITNENMVNEICARFPKLAGTKEKREFVRNLMQGRPSWLKNILTGY